MSRKKNAEKRSFDIDDFLEKHFEDVEALRPDLTVQEEQKRHQELLEKILEFGRGKKLFHTTPVEKK